MISRQMIDKAIAMLAEAANPCKIYLFGSYARGDAREHSDLDFLVVKPLLQQRLKEMVRLQDVLRPLRIPVDIIVISSATFNEWADIPGTIMYQAKKEGLLCYDAT